MTHEELAKQMEPAKTLSNEEFEKLTETVKALSYDEQRRLRNLMDYWLSLPPDQAADKMDERMLRKGTLSRVPPPIDLSTYKRPDPIKIEGEPLSETILRERRGG